MARVYPRWRWSQRTKASSSYPMSVGAVPLITHLPEILGEAGGPEISTIQKGQGKFRHYGEANITFRHHRR